MADLEFAGKKIKSASAADLDRIFAENRIFGVSVHQDTKHELRATIAGETALIFYLDHQQVTSKKPQGRPDRDQTLNLLKFYLKHGSLSPDFEWVNANLPVIDTRAKGCRGTAALLAVAVSLLAAYAGMLAT